MAFDRSSLANYRFTGSAKKIKIKHTVEDTQKLEKKTRQGGGYDW